MIMNTKEKIVEASVKLFNANGVNNVSIRDIGNEIGISSGNFAYHFKNKEVLLSYFYDNMYNEVAIDHLFNKDDGFEKFQLMLTSITEFMLKYSFFYTDIIDIFRLCPNIKKDYSANYVGRKEMYQNVFLQLVEINFLLVKVDDQDFNDLSHKIWFTLTFWQPQKKILPNNTKEVSADYILNQIWNFIFPYMTDVGIKDFQKIRH